MDNYDAKQYGQLVGGTIEGVIIDPSGGDYMTFVGLQVRMPDGTIKHAWVQRDWEGNGPGVLAIENAPNEVTAPPDPPKPPAPAPPSNKNWHTTIDEYIDENVEVLGEGESRLINYLKKSAIHDGEIATSKDFDIEDALRLAMLGVLQTWTSGLETTFYLDPIEVCIDRIIRYMRSNPHIPQKRLENTLHDWKVMIDENVILDAIKTMVSRGQLRTYKVKEKVEGLGTYDIPHVALIFGRGIDDASIFEPPEIAVLEALTVVDCLSINELHDFLGGEKPKLNSLLKNLVGRKKLEKVSEKRGRCRVAYRITKDGKAWLDRWYRVKDARAA